MRCGPRSKKALDEVPCAARSAGRWFYRTLRHVPRIPEPCFDDEQFCTCRRHEAAGMPADNGVHELASPRRLRASCPPPRLLRDAVASARRPLRGVRTFRVFLVVSGPTFGSFLSGVPPARALPLPQVRSPHAPAAPHCKRGQGRREREALRATACCETSHAAQAEASSLKLSTDSLFASAAGQGLADLSRRGTQPSMLFDPGGMRP